MSADELVQACASGNLLRVTELIGSASNPDVLMTKGSSSDHLNCLQTAVRANQIDVVKYLLKKKPELRDINMASMASTVPVNCAIIKGYADMVKLLVDHGASCDPKYAINYLVGVYGLVDSIDLLGMVGLSVTSVDHKGRTTLHGACGHGHVEMAGKVLELGANPNALDVDGRSALHYAAEYGAPAEIFDLLNEYGANVDIGIGSKVGTPLHVAAKEGIFGSINKLAEAGACPDVRDGCYMTPLMYVVQEACVMSQEHMNDGLRALIQAGADVNMAISSDYVDGNALQIALNKRYYAAAELLLLANVTVSWDLCTEGLKKARPALYRAMVDSASNVTTLRHRCRAVIIRSMKYCWPKKKAVDQLALPNLLKQYLLSEELTSLTCPVENKKVNLIVQYL